MSESPIKPHTQSSGTSQKPSEERATAFQELDRLVSQIDPKDARQALEEVKAFVEGKMSWAEVQGIPEQFLLETAAKAYFQLEQGRLENAEILFKGLSILDHKTAYYHTALGVIYQKKKNQLDAIVHYTTALELDPDDITAYVNRGEIYSQIGYDDEALRDFDEAIKRDPQENNAWAQRARLLKKQLEEYLADD